MPNLESVYKRIQKNKKEKNQISKMLRDELASNQRYQELVEKLTKLRLEKKAIEDEVKSVSKSDISRMDDLKVEIQTDIELISDIALNMYVQKENVEIIDENDQKWYPQFKVAFKRSN
ncbi:hypothetical protein KJ766_00765 [Patescibacteria group bacterium]|nr:hypothetical protein [Patescibacteria group bacterium]